MTDTEMTRRKAICTVAGVNDIGEVSDGFHTFNGLYEQRMILFAALVKAYKTKAWKSYRHEDGEYCFGGGWFVVGIDTPEGSYTYHYENKYWDMFECVDLPRAPHWDGHTEADAETRLMSLEPEIKTDGDTISRQAAIDAVSDACFELRGVFGRCEDAIKALPSTQFERKIGQWIFEERKRLVDETDDGAVYRTEKWWSCSECGYTKGYHISKPSSNYCENCGAEMLKEGKE